MGKMSLSVSSHMNHMFLDLAGIGITDPVPCSVGPSDRPFALQDSQALDLVVTALGEQALAPRERHQALILVFPQGTFYTAAALRFYCVRVLRLWRAVLPDKQVPRSVCRCHS